MMKIEAKDGWTPDMSRIEGLEKQLDELAVENNAYIAHAVKSYTSDRIKEVTAALEVTKDKDVISDIHSFLNEVEEGAYFEPHSTKSDTFFTDADALIERATGKKPLRLDRPNEEMDRLLGEDVSWAIGLDGPGIVQDMKDNSYEELVAAGANPKNAHSKYIGLQRKLDKAIKHAENQVKMHNIHVDKKLAKVAPTKEPEFAITDDGRDLHVSVTETTASKIHTTYVRYTGEDREQFIEEATATVAFEDKLLEKQTEDLEESHNEAAAIIAQYNNIFDSIAVGRGSELSKNENKLVSAVYKNGIAWKKCVRDFVEDDGTPAPPSISMTEDDNDYEMEL